MLHETEIGIREAMDADVPPLQGILSYEIVESPYVYLDAPVALQERKRWLVQHREASLAVLIA